MCEFGAAEDCLNCPADCNGVQNGNPTGRYCCGDAGENPIGCGDARCGGGESCTESQGTPSCCGDGECNGTEDSATCQLDCAVAYCAGTCFDLNDDAAINLQDFALFAGCFGLIANEIDLDSCNCADLNGDQHIDLFDFGMLANHFLAPSPTSQPPDCPLSPSDRPGYDVVMTPTATHPRASPQIQVQDRRPEGV